MKPRLHVVRWRDAHLVKDEAGHEEIMRMHRPAIYWTAGILVVSNERGVTVAQDYGLPLVDGEEQTFRTRTFVPRELIEAEFDAGPVIRKGVRRKRRASDLPDAGPDMPGGGTNL